MLREFGLIKRNRVLFPPNNKEMAKIRITKEFSFEGAHALKGYDGKCSHIHGHSYRLAVTVMGEPIEEENSPKKGMVIDFTDLKKIVSEKIIEKLDHALILVKGAELTEEITRFYGNTVTVDFQPTSEMLTIHFAKILKEALPKSVTLVSVRLWETEKNYAEWRAEDNQ